MLKWKKPIADPNIKRWGKDAKLYDSACGNYRVRFFNCFEGMSRPDTFTVILMKNGCEDVVIGHKRAWSGVIKLCREHSKKPIIVHVAAKRVRRTTNRGVNLCKNLK